MGKQLFQSIDLKWLSYKILCTMPLRFLRVVCTVDVSEDETAVFLKMLKCYFLGFTASVLCCGSAKRCLYYSALW